MVINGSRGVDSVQECDNIKVKVTSESAAYTYVYKFRRYVIPPTCDFMVDKVHICTLSVRRDVSCHCLQSINVLLSPSL